MTMVSGSGARVQVFQHQADSKLIQAAPVQNTWYTILDTTKNVRVRGVGFQIADTGETLQVKLTVDAETITVSIAAVANTWYEIVHHSAGSWTTNAAGGTEYGRAATLFEARSFKAEIRKTTVAGVGNLSGTISYAKIP